MRMPPAFPAQSDTMSALALKADMCDATRDAALANSGHIGFKPPCETVWQRHAELLGSLER
jgi:hypothetical protein